MSKFECGCSMIADKINFKKTIHNADGLFVNAIYLFHEYKQYVNVCGSCENKAKLFNDIEKTKLQLAKEQFKILTEETVEEPETETDPDA